MRISQKQALRMIQEDKELIILDVRTRDEYIMGHIKGAINIPNETIRDGWIPCMGVCSAR